MSTLSSELLGQISQAISVDEALDDFEWPDEETEIFMPELETLQAELEIFVNELMGKSELSEMESRRLEILYNLKTQIDGLALAQESAQEPTTSDDEDELPYPRNSELYDYYQ